MRVRTLGALCVVLAALSVLAATRVTGASPDLLAGGRSDVGRATQQQRAALGDEPIAILASGRLEDTLAPANLVKLLALEGRAAKLAGVRIVFGPATFVNQTIVQVEHMMRTTLGPAADRADAVARRTVTAAIARGLPRDEALSVGEQARLRALGPLGDEYRQLLVRYGYIGLPSLENQQFVSALVYGSATAPKRRFAWLFPDASHAVIYVRPRAGLDDGATEQLGRRLQALAGATHLEGVRLRVAGAPLVAASMSDATRRELLRLAPLALLAMALVLLLTCRVAAPRLHLLGLALLAAVLTTGLSAVLGLGLTPATVAALPVVIGLTVDYGVQLQARYWRERRHHPPEEAARLALHAMRNVLVPAAAAMSAGFAVLLLSTVPILQRLGLTLVTGTVVGLTCVLALGGPLLIARDGVGRLPELTLPTLRGRRAAAALAALVVVAGAGLALGSRAQIESDLTRLAAPGQPQLRAVQAVQRELHTSGQLRIAVWADDVASPAALAWMRDAQAQITALDSRLAPGPNLGDLLLSGASSSQATAADVNELLGVVPRYVLDAVMTRDRRRAEMSVGVPLLAVSEQTRLLERIRNVLDGAPPGIHAAPAGLLASAGASVGALHDQRTPLLLLALAAIVAVLALAHRRLDRALIAVAPAVLAAGVSGLLLWATSISLTPLSAGLETLVLAVGVEFGVLLEARYRELRAVGASPRQAAERSRATIGAPVIASALTVSAGFLVLAVSDLQMVRQFGVLVAIELLLCLVFAVLVVPALAAAVDEHPALMAAKKFTSRVLRQSVVMRLAQAGGDSSVIALGSAANRSARPSSIGTTHESG